MEQTPTLNLHDFLEIQNLSTVKLHLGCGEKKWKDYVNVDFYPYDEKIDDTSRKGCIADVFADIRHLELPGNYIDCIFSAHTLEHFTKWESIDFLKDFYRMLKNNGKIEMETPDFNRCILWLFHYSPTLRKKARNQFYGNQWNRLEYETHKYVWSAKELKKTLIEIGYKDVTVTHRTYTHYPGRDMRITAYKR